MTAADGEREALADLIESVGVYIPGSHGHDYINPAKAADAILAAGFRRAPTDEWEYAVQDGDAIRGRFDGDRDRASVEAWWAEQRDLQGRGCTLARRRKAGPWEPAP